MDYDITTYGQSIADVYDSTYGPYEDAAIDRLTELACGGRVLELGIGTGRVALPLAARGVEVHGIDASEAMVAIMRDKPGGETIPVTFGDFATVDMPGKFSLIFAVANTFFGLLSQEEQIRCFQNVARRLDGGGTFLIGAFVPDLQRFTDGQYTITSVIGTDRVGIDTGRHDPVAQRTVHQHIAITADGIRLFPVQLRYAWPSELDLMARVAGMRLRQRFGGWHHQPFTAESREHVSIYERS